MAKYKFFKILFGCGIILGLNTPKNQRSPLVRIVIAGRFHSGQLLGGSFRIELVQTGIVCYFQKKVRLGSRGACVQKRGIFLGKGENHIQMKFVLKVFKQFFKPIPLKGFSIFQDSQIIQAVFRFLKGIAKRKGLLVGLDILKQDIMTELFSYS